MPKNTGRAQPALQCPLHSLERDHTHLWSNIESKVQNELKTHGFCTFWHKSAQFLSISRRIYHFISKTQKTLCFCNFPVARSNRSNPISYSFYLIGLLLRNIQTAKQCLVWISFVPKMENTGRAQPALQCCPLHSLKDHTHLWLKSSKRVENACFFAHVGTHSCQFPGQFMSKTQKTLCANRSNPISYSFYLIGLFEVETLRIQTQNSSRLDLVFAQNGKHWSCSTCLAMLPTAQFREGSYSFVVKH